LVPDTHAYTHDGQRHVSRDRPDIRAQLTGSFADVAQRFTKERHCTRDASRDIKPGCQDHHPAAIAPRSPPSDPRPTGRGARLLPRLRRRSRRWLSDTVGLPIGAVDSPTADALDAVLELRGHVEDLLAVQLPKGFGRD